MTSSVRRTAAPLTLLLLPVLLALLVLLAGAPRAAAHNTLQGTDPADGSTVDTPPSRVTLTFDQPAQALGTEVVVLGPDGAVASTGSAELVDTTVAQALADGLGAGTYTVQWRVTSADGHPLSGELTFTAAAASPVEAPASPTAAATAAAAPSPTATMSAQQEIVEDEDAGLEAGVVAAIVVAVLAAGAVAVFVVRVRRRSGTDRSGD